MKIIGCVVLMLFVAVQFGCMTGAGEESCFEENGQLVCAEEAHVAGVDRQAIINGEQALCMEDEYGNEIADGIVCGRISHDDMGGSFDWTLTVITREFDDGWFSTCVDGCCTSRNDTGCCDTNTCSSWCFTTGRCGMAFSRRPQ